MAQVMAVAFEPYGRLHYLDAAGHDYAVGDQVLVPTDAGPEVAHVVWAPVEVDGFDDLPACQGQAQAADLARDSANRAKRAESLLVARRLVTQHELPMKVVGVDFVDRSDEFDQQVVVYFTAPQRVDFRALLGDLARSLRSRIDLRQIGAREAAQVTGGIGSCGRELCCATHLVEFEPVSLRMARLQDLPANPLQIAGACGRLMCCIAYEHPLYLDYLRAAPSVGERVTTPDGDGVVTGHSVPGAAVLVRTDSGETLRCPLTDVCAQRTASRVGPGRDGNVPPGA